jgi:hypothetical protein
VDSKVDVSEKHTASVFSSKESARRHNLEEHLHRRENLKSQQKFMLFKGLFPLKIVVALLSLLPRVFDGRHVGINDIRKLKNEKVRLFKMA